jgi:hypothetical protein
MCLSLSRTWISIGICHGLFLYSIKKKLLEFWYVSLDRWKVIVLETLNLLLIDRENEVYSDHGQGIQIYFYIMFWIGTGTSMRRR